MAFQAETENGQILDREIVDLNDSAGLFSRAMHSADRSMGILDVTGEMPAVVYVNPAFERLTGYSADEVVGRGLSLLQGPHTNAAALDQLRDSMMSGHASTVTFQQYRRDGSSFWGEVSASPIYDDDGTARNFFVLQTDVTAGILGHRDLEAVYASERAAHLEAKAANARFDAILDQAPVGVIIATPDGQLVRGNTEFERIWREPFVPSKAGDPDRYIGYHENGQRLSPDEWPLSRALQGEILEDEEIVIRRRDGSSGILLTRATPIYDGKQVIAAIAVIEDITERKQSERQLTRERERSWALATTLQRSLLPPELPDIDGLELGAAYTPVSEGLDVGGDFYDVFNQRDGSWVVVIGDVMGKGAEAATITSLARHSLRTAGLRSRRPSSLLGILNQALLREAESVDDRPFCTVAAATFGVDDFGVVVSLALAGHPRPFVMRANGDVHPTGTPGTLVGVLESVEIKDTDVTLNQGDALVMYTDGVTEAHHDDQLLGEEGLAEILRELSKRDMSARELAHSIQAAVVEYSGASLKDDLAILVAKVTDTESATRVHL